MYPHEEVNTLQKLAKDDKALKWTSIKIETLCGSFLGQSSDITIRLLLMNF